ncbi:MAG TPA: LLM class flavin-dependent oxidoreductase [Thermoleophilaceae bacterium]
MELGVYTFAEVHAGDGESWADAAARRLAHLLEEAQLADRLGLEVFGVGEHHRPDFAVSSPAVALAAIAARTNDIRLTSAVTVLSSDEPVRVFQDFATIDLLSGGRAEIMAGRGSFIESFPLFGFDLDDYDTLFADKLDRLLAIRRDEPVNGLGVYPRPLQDPLPVWLAVGGNPPSAIRAGTLGLPMALAIIGGEPARFAPLVDLYRRSGGERVSINSHAYVADSDEQAAEEFFPAYAAMMNRIGAERGWSPMSRPQFDALRSPRGALLVGSPETVAKKIVAQREIFGHGRFLAQMSVGPMPHEQVLRSIELFATEVASRVRSEVALAQQA